MAILSRDLGVLFIQTPHTGSTAIGKLLRQRYGGARLPEQPPGSGAGDGTAKHATLDELLAAATLSSSRGSAPATRRRSGDVSVARRLTGPRTTSRAPTTSSVTSNCKRTSTS